MKSRLIPGVHTMEFRSEFGGPIQNPLKDLGTSVRSTVPLADMDSEDLILPKNSGSDPKVGPKLGLPVHSIYTP